MELVDFPFVTLDVPAGYGEDPRGKFYAHWKGLARPNSEDDLRALLQFASEKRVPVVPYGGGTGLVGGQIFPDFAGAICLSMEKFRQIEIVGDSVLVGAGVILDELHQALMGSGLHFPLSLASSGSAQIGGLIATNAGGVHVIRYGNMGSQVLGLRAMLADGRVLDRSANLRKDNTGFQLDRLMIGSEGALGVITQARLKIVPEDAVLTSILAEVQNPERALALLEQLQRSSLPINAFELISQTTWQIREEAGLESAPIGAPAWSVLFEIAAEVDALAEIDNYIMGETIVASSRAQAEELWQLRETVPLANRKVGAIASHDIALPLDRLLEFIEIMPRQLQAIDEVRVNCFGHLGDGNLHYNLFPAYGRARNDYDAKALSWEVYSQVSKMGGSISAEHGVGRAKGGLLRALGQSEKLEIMREVKAALDPRGIMNPGAFE